MPAALQPAVTLLPMYDDGLCGWRRLEVDVCSRRATYTSRGGTGTGTRSSTGSAASSATASSATARPRPR